MDGEALSVYPPGTEVFLAGDVKATINGVAIYSSGVQYEVVWWASGQRNVAWVSDWEVSTQQHVQVKVWFLGEKFAPG